MVKATGFCKGKYGPHDLSVLGRGKTRSCLACDRKRWAEYRATHYEERRAYNAAYKATHRDEQRAYDAAHREERRAYQKTHLMEARVRQAKYRAAHREELRIKSNAYYASESGFHKRETWRIRVGNLRRLNRCVDRALVELESQ